MSAATSGASYEGLAAMLLAPCSPRWSSVTLYGVANASDADAAGHILGKAILNEGMRGERRGAGATHHDAHKAGGWRRLAVGSWAGTVGMSRLFAALRQTDFIQELILDDCFPASFRLDDLCEYVATRKVLRRLSLRNNAGTVGPSVGPIGRACGTSSSLCSLDLALCGMHDAHVALLFNALAEARHHKMINDDEGSRCADALHLDLSHNNITLDSLAALALAPHTTGRLRALDEGQQHQPHAQDSCSVCSDVDVRTVLQTLVSLDLSGNPLYKRPPRSNTGGSGGAATSTESPALLLMRLVALCPQLTRLRVNDSGLLPDGGMPAACTAARGSHAGSGDLRRLVKAWLSNVLQQATWWLSTPPLSSSATCLAPPAPLRVPWVGTLAKTTASGDADVIRCDVELALGGCSRMSVADVRAVVVAVSDAARGGSGAEGRERDGRSLRSALTLYAIPAVAAALADSATVAALGHLVVLDLRTCALGNEGAVHLGAALERCAAVSPMLLEMLLLSDNALGATGNALGAQAPGNASSGSHGRKGTASNNASRKKDGLQFLCKGLRGSVLPRLRHLDVSWNGIATFRPFVALMEQAAPSFCSLNLSGHTALQWNEGSVGPPPPDDDYQGGANLAAVTYARTSFGKAPVVELALAVQSRLIAAAPSSTPSAAASVHSNTVEGGSFVLTLRDCNCDALGRTFGTVGLKIIA